MHHFKEMDYQKGEMTEAAKTVKSMVAAHATSRWQTKLLMTAYFQQMLLCFSCCNSQTWQTAVLRAKPLTKLLEIEPPQNFLPGAGKRQENSTCMLHYPCGAFQLTLLSQCGGKESYPSLLELFLLGVCTVSSFVLRLEKRNLTPVAFGTRTP